MSYFFISAAHKSSGKTTLSIGLTAALRARGLAVQTFKKGPDYIDPIWLSEASGRRCHNLDFYTQSKPEIEQEFDQAMRGADIGVIEGNKGLYDGLDLDGSNSNAALASLLDAPVLLVIDARGMTRGIAPLILGYQAFDSKIRISGVVLNKVGGSRHEEKLRRVIDHYTDVPVVGAVHFDERLTIDERHLGLVPSNEAGGSREKIVALGEAVAQQVDLDHVIALASSNREEGAVKTSMPPFSATGVKIGYARDRAFGFYYPGDLEKLRRLGVELIPFNTLTDRSLPDVDGLFIGGGFPESMMEELESNQSLKREINRFIENGGPVYAECGGLMYLSRSLTWRGKTCKMVGSVAGDVVMHDRPQGRGYVRLKEVDAPWPQASDAQSVEGDIAAHEFHYSSLENLAPDVRFAYKVIRGTGVNGSSDGIIYKNMLASYTHMRDSQQNPWTERFVAHVLACKS